MCRGGEQDLARQKCTKSLRLKEEARTYLSGTQVTTECVKAAPMELQGPGERQEPTTKGYEDFYRWEEPGFPKAGVMLTAEWGTAQLWVGN